MGKRFYILGLVVFFIFLIDSLLFSQEEEKFQWIWGEVTNIDTAKKLINIKYLDYETDTEKEASFVIDEKTNFEGVNSLEEIKVKDTVSIDYIIEQDKNIARNISVERLEDNTTELPPKE
jgi:hypothetical protein